MQNLVNGVLVDLTAEEIAELEAIAEASLIVTTDMVNAERSRRLLAGGTFGGIYVTGDETNRANLSDLAFGASLRVAAGDTTTETTYRDGNNVDHDLTPPQLLSLWQQAAAHVSLLYVKSWAIKAMEIIPLGYCDDAYWS